jgi:hypothetical protein
MDTGALLAWPKVVLQSLLLRVTTVREYHRRYAMGAGELVDSGLRSGQHPCECLLRLVWQESPREGLTVTLFIKP